MRSRSAILYLPICLTAIAACSSNPMIKELKHNHQESTHILQQQTTRMAMQEEYLAQLTESQLELASTLMRLDQRIRQIEDNVDRFTRGKANQPAKATTTGSPLKNTGLKTETLDIVAPAEKKLVVGRNEWVWLDLLKRNLKARIETGALSSALNATELQPFERNGHDWIRFRVPDEDHPDGGDFYEARLITYVRIRQSSAEHLERRPVVRLKVRLGEYVDEAEFSLTNRQDMLYPVLLGRKFLRDVMLVDVAQKFTQSKYRPDDPVAITQ
jgi:hypothetical protein